MLNTISPPVAPVSPKGAPSRGGLEPPHLHRTQVQVSAVSAPRDAEAQFLNRRRGGQPSNWNAFKHGLYAAKNLSPIQGFSSLKKYAQNMPGKSPVSLIGVVQEYFCLVWELRIKTENLRTALSADKLAHKFFRTLIRLEFARDKQELPLRNLHFVSKYCLGIIRVNIDDIGVSRDADSFRLRLEDGDFTSFAFQESLCASLSDPPYPFITPRQWRVLAPLLPPPDPARRRGRPPIDPRELLDAVFWKLAHHARWQDLPDYYPPMLSCRRYYRRLFLSGRLTTLFSALYQDLVTRGKADLTQFVQNGCFKVTDTTLALGGLDLDEIWQMRTALLFLQLGYRAFRRVRQELKLKRRWGFSSCRILAAERPIFDPPRIKYSESSFIPLDLTAPSSLPSRPPISGFQNWEPLRVRTSYPPKAPAAKRSGRGFRSSHCPKKVTFIPLAAAALPAPPPISNETGDLFPAGENNADQFY